MKHITIKVFRPTGEFLKVWEKARFESFSKEVNAGLSPCIINLGESFDYKGNDLKVGNEIKIFVTDKDTIETNEKERLIYSGYISNIDFWVEGKREGIRITVLGWYTMLAQDIWRDTKSVPGANTTTFDYADNPTDIGTVMRTLLNRYRAEVANPKITYALGDVQITNTTTEYKFEFLTYREGIDILKSLAPSNWFWYVNEWGQFFFKQKSTSIKHRFIFGRHFRQVNVARSLEKLKNIVYLYDDGTNSGGNTLTKFKDLASMQSYGNRAIKVNDNRVRVISDRSKLGDGFVSEHKDPDVKVFAEIIDNNESENFGYDIESINPGDTCIFEGFQTFYAEIFDYPMLITRVDYYFNKAIITIEPLKADIVSRLENINLRVDALERKGVPTTYT